MESDESKLHNDNTEQLINGMMSFLDEPTENFKHEEFDGSKNTLCAGIKNIMEMFPSPPTLQQPFQNLNSSVPIHQEHNNNETKSSNFEKVCRHKDPYMQEVNRLMFCSTMGHPPNDSPEYFHAAEDYALHGKEFLDFPTSMKFSKPMDSSYFDGDMPTHFPTSFPKSNPAQGLALQTGKYSNLGNAGVPQLPVMMNPANYWGYHFYQTPNLVQPLMYSNPFLMTQYLNMFVRETQINTSIVQQHQFLSGGINERLVYAQMLQQQIQTNQGVPVNFPNFSGSPTLGVGKPKLRLQDIKKSELNNQICDGSDFMKTNLNGNNSYENNLDLNN